MIDLKNETVLSFTSATKHLPHRRAGKKPHVATLYRWASCGLRGIRLETIQVGGTLCTSLEALQRFFDGLGAQSGVRTLPTTPTREAEIRRAEEELRKLKI